MHEHVVGSGPGHNLCENKKGRAKKGSTEEIWARSAVPKCAANLSAFVLTLCYAMLNVCATRS
jgi:hypothetical protein